MGGQKWTDLGLGAADTALPRSVEQWPEGAYTAYRERMAMVLTDPWVDEGEAAAQAELEVRELVRAGRLDAWS